MSDQHTLSLTGSLQDARLRDASSFAEFSPEIQRGMYRRLGGVALVYSGAWAANYLYYQITAHSMSDVDSRTFWHISTLVCTLMGIAVYVLCRAHRIPAHLFTRFAVTFEIAAALGIMAGWLGWEHNIEKMLYRVAAAFELDHNDLLDGVVHPLQQQQVRLFQHEGVSWVSVWLLAFPLVVPFSMRRTVIATLLTAATVPAVLLVSLWINGVPESVRPWAFPYILEISIPTFICAGIAIVGSCVVYGLTRDLSEARQMGSYQLVEKIGAGGMGEVWKAKHRLLARPAAIKLIRPETLGGKNATATTALKRFEREAQATAGLSSPHSIDLYDFGITDDGTFYYVMELLSGVDLKSLVERFGPLPAERATFILRQTCHSLTDAHLTGVIHRDIKPGNIFVCRNGAEYDFVKVLDFGLVKHLGDIETESTQLTVEGIASGTPAFMAPEMVYGKRVLDGRADIYALGCVAYWLLTGHLVFEGGSPVATLLSHARDAPLPPSERTELHVPSDLERVILMCLEKDPEKRPQSTRELSELLVACEKHLRPWNEERAAEWWQTHLPHLITQPRDLATAGLPGD